MLPSACNPRTRRRDALAELTPANELNRYSEAIAGGGRLVANPKSTLCIYDWARPYLAGDRYAEAESGFRDHCVGRRPLPTG